MKPSAARLLLFSNTASYRRLAGIVAGVAVAVAMLLIMLGTYLHLPDRADRAAWATVPGTAVTATDGTLSDGVTPKFAESPGVILRHAGTDYLGSTPIDVVRVAATQDTAVTFPGSLAAPRPGEYYASPAMADLIASTPADELGDRYGTMIGELPPSTLKGPTQLAVLAGADWDQLTSLGNVDAVSDFATRSTRSDSTTYRLVIAIGSIALLVPITLLIGIVSQLGAAERRERFATVRLIGAGRKAIATLSGLEMGLASLAGAVAGIGLMYVLRPAAALIKVLGSESYLRDLTPSAGWMAVAALGIAVLGGLSAWWRTYRDDVGALGSSRERAEKRVTLARFIPLALGITMFAGATLTVNSQSAGGSLFALGLLGGFALTAFGIVFAGPWMTKVLAVLFTRTARTAPSMVAAGRLSRHPRATFRSVAGLVVAVFLVSMFAGSASVVSAIAKPTDVAGMISLDAVTAPVASTTDVAALVGALESTPGVTRAVMAYKGDGGGDVMTAADAAAVGLIPPAGAQAVEVNLSGALNENVGRTTSEPPVSVPAIDTSVPYDVIALTDGTDASIERARTTMVASGMVTSPPQTRATYADAGAMTMINELGVMAYIGMGIAVAISALALTVATIAAALDRKRTFGLLRLSGMPVRALRRVITTEAAVPLSVTLLASSGLGFLMAWLMIAALGSDASMGAPDARYWVAIAASLALGAAAITSSFGMVRRSTELTSTRFE